VADEQSAVLVERDEVTVMFKGVADEQAAIERGWAELEQWSARFVDASSSGLSTRRHASTGSACSFARTIVLMS
jgi:hypothetical protein